MKLNQPFYNDKDATYIDSITKSSAVSFVTPEEMAQDCSTDNDCGIYEQVFGKEIVFNESEEAKRIVCNKSEEANKIVCNEYVEANKNVCNESKEANKIVCNEYVEAHKIVCNESEDAKRIVCNKSEEANKIVSNESEKENKIVCNESEEADATSINLNNPYIVILPAKEITQAISETDMPPGRASSCNLKSGKNRILVFAVGLLTLSSIACLVVWIQQTSRRYECY